ncbi:MAG: DUF1905 domain-containing protein [Actinophytocola sp.]|nr:DUF1905 domain-containing protein [Actinophytocola sp.]
MQWTFTGEIERFPGPGGWYHVDVPADISDEFERDGFIPVIAEVGVSQWETSVMPKGDGTRFVAIKAAIRKANNLDEGDQVTVIIRRR